MEIIEGTAEQANREWDAEMTLKAYDPQETLATFDCPEGSVHYPIRRGVRMIDVEAAVKESLL